MPAPKSWEGFTWASGRVTAAKRDKVKELMKAGKKPEEIAEGFGAKLETIQAIKKGDFDSLVESKAKPVKKRAAAKKKAAADTKAKPKEKITFSPRNPFYKQAVKWEDNRKLEKDIKEKEKELERLRKKVAGTAKPKAKSKTK